MTYEEAIAFIHGTYKFGSKLGLDNIETLLELLGSPHKTLKFIHVAGTNGKGSTSAFIHSVLIEAGYKTGLYTSPFIETFNERMRVNHNLITSEELAQLTGQVKSKIDIMIEQGYKHPTEFEVVTAIAMLYYKFHACDVVVLEVGLGGRLDATNVIETPLVSVITPLDFDHTEYLGNTIEAIAGEKSGIIKKNGITVSCPQLPGAMHVIENKCHEMSNTLYKVAFDSLEITHQDFGQLTFIYLGETYDITLFASYQSENATLAIETLKILVNHHGFKIDNGHIKNGLKHAQWIGRLEIVSKEPFIIIDGAHNLHGIKGLAKSIEALGGKLHIVGLVGILKDKDVDGMLEIILPYLDSVIVTKPDNPRAMSASELATHFKGIEILNVCETISDAVTAMYAHYSKNFDESSQILYLAFGSLYMIGEVRTLALNHGKQDVH
jgi:dihydrofolate synthase/folylpolyglutamate synthase